MENIFITFTASFLLWLMFAGLIILWLIDGKIKKEQAVHALFASLIAWVITQMIKELFPTGRPFMVNGEAPMTLTIPADGAFPSGHSAVAFALAMTVYLHDKRVGLMFLILAFLVGLGRIFANVHYPLDILGGAAIGMFVSYLIERMHLYKLIRRG